MVSTSTAAGDSSTRRSGAHAKGTVIQARIDYARSLGPEAFERWVARLSPEARDLANEGALVNSWYPLELFVEMSTILDQTFGDGDYGLCRQLGRQSFDKYSGTVYRLMFRALTLEFLMRRAAVAWKLHYDRGDLKHEPVRRLDDGRRETVVSLRRMPMSDPAHCHAVRGWIVRAGEMTGAKDIEESCVTCRKRGDEACSWRFRYR